MENSLSEDFFFISTDKDMEWKSRFITEVNKESIRGLVLTTVSFIDELLIKILKAYFPDKDYANKLLNDLDGCLSTISYRSNICYALALIHEQEHKSIKILARIRNEFAHKWDGTNFDNECISKLVSSFSPKYFLGKTGNNKAKFIRVASNTIQNLSIRIERTEKICNLLPKKLIYFEDLSEEERTNFLNNKTGSNNILLS